MKQSRLVYFSNAGVPATGLLPTFTQYINVDTLVGATAPAITEIGGGWYKYPDTITDFDHIVGIIDGTATLADADRYKSVELNQGDLNCGITVEVSQVYNEETDTLTLLVNAEQEGQLLQSGMTQMDIDIYDTTNTIIMTGSDSTLENGVGTFTLSVPTIEKNQIYYILAQVTLNNGAIATGMTSYMVIE